MTSSGKSKGKGVLVTHSENYMYYDQVDNSSFKKNTAATTFYMTCSEKGKSGCNARAVVKKVTIPGEEGKEDTVDYILAKVSKEEVSERIFSLDFL